MILKPGQTGIFKSKKGKMYELCNENGVLVCVGLPENKKRKPTKEILKNVKLESIPSYTIYSKGYFTPDGNGGVGVVIVDNETSEIKEMCENVSSVTNNGIYITAVIIAVESLPDGSEVSIISDSQYIVNTINGIFSRKSNLDLWERLYSSLKNMKYTASWIKGDSGDSLLERCNELARTAIYPIKSYPDKIKNDYDNSYEFVNGNQEEILKYSQKYHVNFECAKSLCEFWNTPQKKFKTYKNLKTGGLDHWSSYKLDDLTPLMKTGAVDIIKRYIGDLKDIEACLRWKVRGLSLADSIHKTLVDIEIKNNARQSKFKE